MKKTLLSLICIILLLLAFCGCSKTGGNSAKSGKSGKEKSSVSTADKEEKEEEKEENEKSSKVTDSSDLLESYQAPADVVKIDKKEEDPSNDNIKFQYDDKGRVSSCAFLEGGQKIAVIYTYNDSDNTVSIFAFTDDGMLIDDKTIELSNFDPDKGFAKIEGYYFKGYTAK